VLYLEEVSKSNGLEKELIKFEAAKWFRANYGKNFDFWRGFTKIEM
jgi:hypothetical protein